MEANGRTDGQTNGRTLPIALPSRLTRSVQLLLITNYCHFYDEFTHFYLQIT